MAATCTMTCTTTLSKELLAEMPAETQEAVTKAKLGGSEAVKAALLELGKVDDALDGHAKEIQAVAPTLGEDIIKFRMDYEQFLRRIASYAIKTRSAATANLRVVEINKAKGIVLSVKKPLQGTSDLLTESRQLQERALMLKRMISFQLPSGWNWKNVLVYSLLGLACIAALVAATPLAVGAGCTMVAGIIVLAASSGAHAVYRDRKSEIGRIDKAAKDLEVKLEKIGKQMKDIQMALQRGDSHQDALNDLADTLEADPDLLDCLSDQIKLCLKQIIKECNELEALAKTNYFKEGKQ